MAIFLDGIGFLCRMTNVPIKAPVDVEKANEEVYMGWKGVLTFIKGGGEIELVGLFKTLVYLLLNCLALK